MKRSGRSFLFQDAWRFMEEARGEVFSVVVHSQA
jgi:hypothetical protein